MAIVLSEPTLKVEGRCCRVVRWCFPIHDLVEITGDTVFAFDPDAVSTAAGSKEERGGGGVSLSCLMIWRKRCWLYGKEFDSQETPEALPARSPYGRWGGSNYHPSGGWLLAGSGGDERSITWPQEAHNKRDPRQAFFTALMGVFRGA